MSIVSADLAGSALGGSALASNELAFIAAQLRRAPGPADVFGALRGPRAEQVQQLRGTYRRLALAVHPDRHGDDPLAGEAFVMLQRLFEAALEQVRLGRYGHASGPAGSNGATGPVVVTTRRRTYIIGEQLAQGDLASLYTCSISEGAQQGSGILKIARDSQDNDLLLNEAQTLRHLLAPRDREPIPAYIPRLLESFLYEDAPGVRRQVNAFPSVVTERGALPADALYSLEEVRQAHRGGVDPKQMAWMWRRLLIALGHAHDRAVIHGAVLPSHILILPAEHGLLLVDWCASVRRPAETGSHIPTVSADYERWYPLSVLARAVPTPAIDLELALRSMVFLLGGDPLTGALPPRVPGPLQAYLQGALATGAAHTTAGALYRQFSSLIFALWGKRTFVPFAMPARPNSRPTR